MALNIYNIAKDPLAGLNNSGIARLGLLIPTDDSVDLPAYVVGCVVTAGDIIFLPPINDPSDPITITAAPVGYVVPWQISRLLATGTTAVLRTLDKAF